LSAVAQTLAADSILFSTDKNGQNRS